MREKVARRVEEGWLQCSPKGCGKLSIIMSICGNFAELAVCKDQPRDFGDTGTLPQRTLVPSQGRPDRSSLLVDADPLG